MNLKEIISRIKLITGLNQGQIATDIYRTSPNNLSNKVSRNTIDIEIIGEWAEHQGVSFDWLLTGHGEPYLSNSVNEKGANQQGNVISLEHSELVKHFTDKVLAKEVNQHLLEIEALNKGAFKEACAYIKGIAAGLKASAVEYDRRQGDRRQDEDESWNQNQERRNGERRKASGE